MSSVAFRLPEETLVALDDDTKTVHVQKRRRLGSA
jgi:hypothetical protein